MLPGGRGSVTIRDCVHRKNVPSLAAHKKCGFHIAKENGTDYLDGSVSDHQYGMLCSERSGTQRFCRCVLLRLSTVHRNP